MPYIEPKKNFKSNIREINLGNINYAKSFSLPFLKSENGTSKSLFALEILLNIPKNYSKVLSDFWGDLNNDMLSWAKKAQDYPCDILGLKFNVNNESEIEKSVKLFSEILKISKKPLLVTGSNKKNLDTVLLPKLAEIADIPCVFGIAEENSYKELAKVAIKNGHYIIARTPIDINLAKELNILLVDAGVSPDKILIDPNMAALGYGLDYGYSIMERIKLAGLGGDEMLNMPIIAFAGEEAWKVKEARVDDFGTQNYGTLTERGIAWESATATAVMHAGANILVLWHPEVITNLKNFAYNN